jgi:hypothetical protein
MKKSFIKKNFYAESKRFELLIPFRVYTLSRRAPSTTRTTLLFKGRQKYSIRPYEPNIFCVFAVVMAAISSTGLFFTVASFSTTYFK